MRLTDAQIIELAPEWATHYEVYDGGGSVFESKDYYQRRNSFGAWGEKTAQPSWGTLEDSIPIPRKPANKLPNNTAVLRSEVETQADLDAMVKVAEYNGFDMSNDKEHILNEYTYKFVSVSDDCDCLQNEDDEELNIITLKEFLSYGENKVEEINGSTLELIKAAQDEPCKPPIEQIADIMRREGITSLTLHMISTGQVTGSFDVETGRSSESE